MSDQPKMVSASHDGRRFKVPAVIVVGEEHPHRPVEVAIDGRTVAHLTGEVRVVDGLPAFSQVALTIYEPMSPVDLARIPWGKYTREILQAAADPDDRPYRRSTDELLDEVEKLRAEAEAQGLPYASYVGERLGYKSDPYVRRLAGKARNRSRPHS